MSSGDASNTVVQPLPLLDLSSTITSNAEIISQHLKNHALPQPSFLRDGPATVVPPESPAHVRKARQKLIAASLEILQLAIGPQEYLPNLATGVNLPASRKRLVLIVFRFVPLNGSISYTDLAAATHVPEERLKAVLGMAMTNAMFREEPGKLVSHSATSAFLARDESAYAYATYMCSKSAPMALQMTAASQRWGPGTLSKSETAYNIAFDTDLPFFDHVSQDAYRMAEFAKYMQNVRSSDSVDLQHLVSGFAWQSVRTDGIVVDVGGSTGGAAIALAQAYDQLVFIVQDLPTNAENGRKNVETLPCNISSRITFQAHDFNDSQPVQQADIYLLRMILHDWPDEDAIKILQNIVAVMQQGQSRLLIMDTVLPAPGSVPLSVERIARARDLTMMQAFNSKERDLEDWKGLLKMSDQRLRIVAVVQPVGSAMSVLEVVLDSN
ncbi:hypothetical protein MBLNU459_g0806t2 [Dothideomycetes sp. NU459]